MKSVHWLKPERKRQQGIFLGRVMVNWSARKSGPKFFSPELFILFGLQHSMTKFIDQEILDLPSEQVQKQDLRFTVDPRLWLQHDSQNVRIRSRT